MVRKVSILLLLVCLVATAFADSTPTKADRGRVRVVASPDPAGGPALKVLRTDTDSPLRAGTAWIWSKQWQEEPFAYYAEMRSRGLNAVRIILFDTWEHEAGYGGGDWNDATYRTAALARIERAVNFASENGMYVILNSHNKIPQYDEAYNTALWQHVAPHFARRTHVLYEVSNETLEGTQINASGVFGGSTARLRQLRAQYDLVRGLAPDTQIMVLTPAGVSGWGYVDGMNRLVQAWLAQPGGTVDWTKTSLAYHLYHADSGLFPNAEDLRRFHSEYPGWPSENNFPASVTSGQLGIPASDTWRSVSYGTELFVTQTCERLGLGWSHWHINRMNQLEQNFPLIWNDALAKNYAWTPDPVLNARRKINAGGESIASFTRDLNFFGGKVALHDPNVAVDRTGEPEAAPPEMYQSERWGHFRYVFARLEPNARAIALLHFSERYAEINAPGQRVFDVRWNGNLVLSDFDIFAAAGGRDRAVMRRVSGFADAQGQVTLEFVPKVQFAKVDAIELTLPRRRGLSIRPRPDKPSLL
ncbi:MAG: malectin domain-containing carbohydrate-binding protein [Fimbriimonadaceae bacterium]|nr:malectin domain-containing carbohydrate-binding protein [Fimbriimonadaceae bacterium]